MKIELIYISFEVLSFDFKGGCLRVSSNLLNGFMNLGFLNYIYWYENLFVLIYDSNVKKFNNI